jgi:alpha-L-fucosidase
VEHRRRHALREGRAEALAEECRNQDVKLFFYHSHLDWTHPITTRAAAPASIPAAPSPATSTATSTSWTPNSRNCSRSTATSPASGSTASGTARTPNWRLRKTYDLIHRLQPHALVGNNHHLAPFEGEDFQMFEKDLPGQNTTGFSGEAKIGTLPLETCETINGAWGYHATDRRFKSTRDLLHYLIKAAGMNANFLLNVGPTPEGTIQPEFVTRLKEMGAWLAKFGDSIYGTRGGPLPPRPWGVTTQKPAACTPTFSTGPIPHWSSRACRCR